MAKRREIRVYPSSMGTRYAKGKQPPWIARRLRNVLLDQGTVSRGLGMVRPDVASMGVTQIIKGCGTWQRRDGERYLVWCQDNGTVAAEVSVQPAHLEADF